ncbi:ankyrin repeat-containing protein ITN1-like isoform X4 [Quercus robur]|uniref:ankyrin repeat-containing protein ITN1-like isoform X4 n=1 Tax=Quercus robur TaxID=38942 RepID=UPI002161175D|nr:ankyrin repeat-containing protein ITN1-like isoform X4 [Quercus robur]
METKPALSAAVLEALNENNYLDWSVQLKTYLMAQDLWEIVESRSDPPAPEIEAAFKAWSKTNAMALHVIQMSCQPNRFSDIREISSAGIAWYTLAEKYKPKSPDPSSSIAPVPLRKDELLDSSKSGENDKKGNINDDVEIYTELNKALQSGDWNAAKEFLNTHPHAISAKITDTNKTALHVAAEAGHEHIVEELVNIMSEENLEIKDFEGFTALAQASFRGSYRMVECMLGKNKNLTSMGHDEGNIPLILALYNGQLDLARYLYLLTPLEILVPENGTMGAAIVSEAIYNKALDIALDLVKLCPRLAIAQDRIGYCPLYALACMPDYFLGGNQLVFWKRWIYSGLSSLSQLVSNLRTLFGIKHLYEMKLAHFLSNELLRCMRDQLSISNIQQIRAGRVEDAILRATKEGIFEIVFEMVKANPQLVWSHDARSRNIFSVAVEYRRAKIFSLIHGLNIENGLAGFPDFTNKNNLLHMAGMSAASTSLNQIPGAALKMQRELQWFKEVESIVPSKSHGFLNKEGLTPRQLFTKNHADMMSNGEKWMKDTASSCTVVGALIVTIMFAAAFTVPGGNDQNKGFPIFLNEKLFMVFIVSDALSLFSSSTSVLMFLGILTSRYAEEDFLKSLPKKMIIGLSTLFFSIAAMMIAFSASLFLMLREQSWIFIPVICLASVPVTLFVLMQFPLLVDMTILTYRPRIFNRKMERWF